ncbi:MAG TPA: ATP-binding protein [Kofleriaceae bacterium]|nr:ATP-binding protein [Kofleriaceae bacterium]
MGSSIPDNEHARLGALRALGILDTPPEPFFDALTTLAASVFVVPIAVVVLIDDNRQWFKSRHGLAVEQTNRGIAFCAHTIGGPDVTVVEDALTDARFAEDPLVTGDPFIRFYAGAPLRTRDGLDIGTVAILDRAPRRFDEADRRLLVRLAGTVMAEIERRAELSPAQAAVERSDPRLRHALAQLPAVLWTTDRCLRFTSITGAMLSSVAMDEAQLLGVSLEQLFEGDPSLEMVLDVHRRAVAGEQVSYPLHWGSLSCHAHLGPLRDAANEIIGTLGISIDVSEQVRAEQALRRSESRFRLIADATIDVVWDWDVLDGTVIWNQGVCGVLGHAREDVGSDIAWWEEQIAPEDRARVVASFRAAVASGADDWSDEHHLLRAGGDRAEVQQRVRILRDVRGAPVQVLGAIIDVTERNRTQRRLLHADRLVSIGTLAAGVAHEVNNPLAYVLTNTQYAAGQVGEALDGALPASLRARLEQVKTALEDTVVGARRVARIVKDLKTYAREPSASEDERADPVRAAEAAITMTQSSINQVAVLELSLRPAPPVAIDEARLVQVLVNLLVNAVHAVHARPAPDHRIALSTRGGQGCAIIEVSDTGIGISRALLPRIFDPFFTTKAGTGTGLGLSIVGNLVQQAGGRIEVDSDCGKGSHFRIQLPAAARIPAAPGRVASAEAPPPPAEIPRRRVLVIDDEPRIVRVIERSFAQGHDVVGVIGGRAALEVLAEDTSFDLILCDVVMPDVSGVDLHAALVATAPDVARRVVFMTGGAFTDRASAFLDRVPNRRLVKPFDLQAVEALLADPPR